MSEKDVLNKFVQWIDENHKDWRVKTEVPVGDMRADGRIDEADENGITKDIVAYFEVKAEHIDLKGLLTGLAQAQYIREHTLREVWLILKHQHVQRLLGAKKKGIGGIKLFDVDEQQLVDYETIKEQMSKSRMKRYQEQTIQTWSKDFTIETISPIGVTTTGAKFDGENLMFNLGQRVRGMIKKIAKTISGTLSEQVKYSIYVEPLQIPIAKKQELEFITNYIPTSRGSSSKREMYEVASGKVLTFKVRCVGKKLTPELVEDLIRQGGMFCGLGDSHSDGFHGRFNLLNEKQIKEKD